MDKKLIQEFDKKQKSQKQKKHKQHSQSSGCKNKHAKVEEPTFSTPSTSYRDRAKERREGINRDFELDPDDLRVSINPVSHVDDTTNREQIDEEERRRQQIEESKYLGGDIEHTHLVKGLDFALLEKVKNDQRLAERLRCDREDNHGSKFDAADSDSEEEEFRKEAILAASSTSSKRQLIDLEKLRKGQSTEIIPCRTALARRILNVMDEKWPNKSELFLPGRMTYIIPIDEDNENPITTILKSKADASVQDESGLPNESDFALDQLIDRLGRIRRGETNTETKRLKSWDRDDAMDDYGYIEYG